MAARFEEDYDNPVECANCGETMGLMRCSRCKQIYFCSPVCQKAYWPFHKQECKKNEFADIIESEDDKFAAWMRRHGKMAVLRDDQVHRLEATQTSRARSDVMENMYGKINPQPKGTEYTREEKNKMETANIKENEEVYLETSQDKYWESIEIDCKLGLDCRRYKWRQNQSFVEIFIKLTPKLSRKKVKVQIQPNQLQVVIDEETIIEGTLYQSIKAGDSTWIVGDENVLEIILLKANRRGRYQDGTSNADTFWFSLLKNSSQYEKIAGEYPPTSYYFSFTDNQDLPQQNFYSQQQRPIQT